jgi:hypothetical protein
VEILTRTKDDAENKALFERIIEVIGDGVSVEVVLACRWDGDGEWVGPNEQPEAWREASAYKRRA